jgi:uncharacterized membrane protein
VGILVGFAPWIVYWVLVGNVPFAIAVLVALAVAIAGVVISQRRRSGRNVLEIGSAATFLVLMVLTSTLSQAVLQRWMLPLSNAGLLLVTLTGALIGTPVVKETAGSEPFARLTTRLTWMWIGVSAAMTVSSSIPSIVHGDATFLDSKRPLCFLGYWVIPLVLFAAAALAATMLADKLPAEVENTPRKTTFVAFDEATIDELYFLAQEHANREVGAGKEAYDVKVGGLGTPLVGDDSRKSWPATYKVRART